MGGNASKAIVSKAVKPIKNINVQNRAQKAIEKHKTNPKPAPKPPSTVPFIEKQIQEFPEVKEELERKDETLLNRMGQLNIEVTGKNPEIMTSKRPLPQNRDYIEDPMLFNEKPQKIPIGKVSLYQVAEIYDKALRRSNEYGAERIAMEYKLDIRETKNLLKYFRMWTEVGEETSYYDYLEQKGELHLSRLGKVKRPLTKRLDAGVTPNMGRAKKPV